MNDIFDELIETAPLKEKRWNQVENKWNVFFPGLLCLVIEHSSTKATKKVINW